MQNTNSIESKSSIIVKESGDNIQKWSDGKWEQVCLGTGTGSSEEDTEHLEAGLPMKVMKFMGLPKSYRHALYNEFVQDVTQIPGETASSFFNIVSWVCGKKEGNAENSMTEKVSSLGEGDASVNKIQVVTKSSAGRAEGAVTKKDGNSASNTKIAVPDTILEEEDETLLTPIEAIEEGPCIQACILEEKTQSQAPSVLHLDPNRNKVVRNHTVHECFSEAAIYAHCVSETESEGGALAVTNSTRMSLGLDTEDVEEDVKRVKFAPTSETNIYAYHDYDEEEVETQTDNEDNSREDSVEEQDTEEMHEVEEPPYELVDCHSSTQTPDHIQCLPENMTPPWSALSEISNDEAFQTTKEVIEPIEPVISTKIGKLHEAKQNSISSKPEKVVRSTSEVQLQLNNDLKTLEDIVKNIYKNLNKKGPLTIVANFKPKENGELAMDMSSSATGQSNKVAVSSQKPSMSTEGKEKPIPKLSSTKKVVDEKVKEKAEFKSVSEKKQQGKDLAVTKYRDAETTEKKQAYTKIPAKVQIQQRKESVQKSRPVTSLEPRTPPVSTAKNSQEKPVTSYPPSTRKSSVSLTKSSLASSKSSNVGAEKLVTIDKNNNVFELETPSTAPLKPAIKFKNKMPTLRPDTSSHSVFQAVIVPPKNADATAPKLKSTHTKHYTLQAPASEHALVQQQQGLQQQQYTIVESDFHKYLVPVTAQSQHIIASTATSQHVLLQPSQQAHLFQAEAESTLSKHIILQSPESKQIFIQNTPPQLVMEAPTPVQHILVENPPPPTCPNPYLHPRTATILPPSPSPRSQGSYRLIQPCMMHSQNQRNCERRSQDEDSVVSDSASNTSMVSSVSSAVSGGDCVSTTGGSGGEAVAEHEIPILIRPTFSSPKIDKRHSNSRKSSVKLHSRNQQSMVNASRSSTSKPCCSRNRVPTSPPKPSSYTAIFQERRKQQNNNKQTVYVDLRSDGHKNR